MTALAGLERASSLNPPPDRSLTAEALTVQTGEHTDFWRDTRYGFRRDSGHGRAGPP